jgi:hypothetical protein
MGYEVIVTSNTGEVREEACFNVGLCLQHLSGRVEEIQEMPCQYGIAGPNCDSNWLFTECVSDTLPESSCVVLPELLFVLIPV